MKQVFYLTIVLFLVGSCKKDTGNYHAVESYLGTVKASLKDSLSASDYASLDFTKAVLSKADSVQLNFLRIPFKGKKLRNDFLLLQTNSDGRVQRGRIIHLEGGQKEYERGNLKRRTWEGSIEIRSLDRKTVLHSAIKDGYIEVFHPQANTRMAVVPQDNVLPEIIVVAYISPSYGISYYDWMYLQGLFYNPYDFGGGGGSTGSDYYYGSMDGSGSSYYGGGERYYDGGSGSNNNSYSEVLLDPLISVDVDTYVNNPAIDIEKYLKCFDAIPDAGSTCSIEIFTDIPVDNDPNKLFNLGTQYPGHTFIQIKKSNGSQSAIQNIGFYPKTNWKSILTTAPIDGKFVDNGQHEFNASIKMSISSENFRSMITEIRYLARFIKYDIDEYNCTDFALDVFNKVRSNKLEIPMYDIPGGMAAGGTRTPQGLYNKLKQMWNDNDPETVNISIGLLKGWVANSDGPCE